MNTWRINGFFSPSFCPGSRLFTSKVGLGTPNNLLFLLTFVFSFLNYTRRRLPPPDWLEDVSFSKGFISPLPVFEGLKERVVLVTNPGNPGKAWRGFKQSKKRKKTGGEVSFNMKGKQWIRKATVRQKKGLIREICPGQGSASTRPCASRHVEITVKGLRVKGVFILFKLTSQGGKRTHSVLHSSTHKNTQCLC